VKEHGKKKEDRGRAGQHCLGSTSPIPPQGRRRGGSTFVAGEDQASLYRTAAWGGGKKRKKKKASPPSLTVERTVTQVKHYLLGGKKKGPALCSEVTHSEFIPDETEKKKKEKHSARGTATKKVRVGGFCPTADKKEGARRFRPPGEHPKEKKKRHGQKKPVSSGLPSAGCRKRGKEKKRKRSTNLAGPRVGRLLTA